MTNYQVSDDVDDPFLKITQNSLIMDNGTAFKRKKRTRFGRMIPFEIWGKTFNIGPDYKFFCGAFPLLFSLGAALIYLQIRFQSSGWLLLISVLVNLLQTSTYIAIFLSNPGIVSQSINPQQNPGAKFCSQCQIFVQKSTYHCQDCSVCISKLDHHCPWTSKCIGSNNLCLFYVFVVSIFIALLYNMMVLPLSFAPNIGAA